MKKEQYPFSSQIPYRWEVCFLPDCLQKEACLRYRMYLEACADCRAVYAVTPAARVGETCSAFVPMRVVRKARGMHRLMDSLPAKLAQQLKHELYIFLNGRSNFYRYLHGEMLLSPAQQREIAERVARMGCDLQVEFDSYVEEPDFYCEQ